VWPGGRLLSSCVQRVAHLDPEDFPTLN
jgi:hypothetical protein